MSFLVLFICLDFITDPFKIYWKAPQKNLLHLVKCIRSSTHFLFSLGNSRSDLPHFLIWTGFSLGLLHCCHLKISLHCHLRLFFCFSPVFDSLFPESHIFFFLGLCPLNSLYWKFWIQNNFPQNSAIINPLSGFQGSC